MNIAIPSFLVITINVASAQTWSNWENCVPSSACYKTRTVHCGGRRAGMSCVEQDEVYHETLENGCSKACSSSWVGLQETTQCSGTCYDSAKTQQVTCENTSSCKKTRRVRCYEESTCNGRWLPVSRMKCSKKCGGGKWIVRMKCVTVENSFPASYNCNGTNGSLSTRLVTLVDSCNDFPCPTWSTWTAVTSCTKNCTGFRTLVGNCTFQGALSTLCDEKGKESSRTRTEPCDIDCLRCEEAKCQTTVASVATDISILGPACAGGGILLLVAISFSVLWYKKNKDKMIERTGIGQQEHADSMEHKKSAGMYSDLELATKPAKKEAQSFPHKNSALEEQAERTRSQKPSQSGTQEFSASDEEVTCSAASQTRAAHGKRKRHRPRNFDFPKSLQLSRDSKYEIM